MGVKRKVAKVILLVLILLNLFDFFQLLPGDLDFGKKILSWTLLALVFLKVDFTWLFLGEKKDTQLNKRIPDIAILLLFFVLSLKELIIIARIDSSAVIFRPFFEFLVSQGHLLNKLSFYIGGIGLLLMAGYLAWYVKIQETSLLGNFRVDKAPFIVRWPAIFLLLVSFYVLVFDLLVEWLVIATDSLLILISLGIYVFVIVKFHKKFDSSRMIHKVGGFAERFEEKFISFFHDKTHIFLGITGLLVLHLLTEIGNFLVPYVLGFANSFYFESLELNSLIGLFLADSASENILVVLCIYALNIIMLTLLTILPALMWYEVYKGETKRLPKLLIGIFFAGIIPFILAPLFSFSALNTSGFVGVNILAHSIASPNLLLIAIASLLFGSAMYALAFIPAIKHVQYHVVILGSLVFLFYYLGLFYSSTSQYYTNTLKSLLAAGEYFIFFFIGLFFLVKVMFFVFGSMKFIIQLFKHHLL